MKKCMRLIVFLSGLVFLTGIRADDLWTTGLPTDYKNSRDSYDDLRAHNHGVDGDDVSLHSQSDNRAHRAAQIVGYKASRVRE